MSEFEIKIYAKAIKKSFGLYDHYFIIIDNHEYHLGCYTKGSKLNAGTTKGAHLITTRKLCHKCFNLLLINLEKKEDQRLFWYYPFINCESLAIGCSLQVLMTCNIPIAFCLLIKGYFVFAILLILFILTIVLFWSKYLYSRTTFTYCKHLKKNKLV